MLTLRLRTGGTLQCRINEFVAFVEIFVLGDYEVPGLDWQSLSTIVDVGANVGIATVWFARKAPNATVLAVEPSPLALSLLESNLNANGFNSRVQVLRVALGGASGTGYVQPSDSTVGTRVTSTPEPQLGVAEPVPLLTLSELINDSRLTQIDLLKLDCEGAEYDVLLSVDKAGLNQIVTIIGEYHQVNGHHPEELQVHLEQAGFEVQLRPHPRDPILGTFIARHARPTMPAGLAEDPAPDRSAMTTIAVVIPTYRRSAEVNRLLTSLFESTRQPDEVVIVDNDPDASCQASWPSHWPVRIIPSGLGLNVSSARNIGWRSTHSDLCVFIDDDNTVAGTALSVLAQGVTSSDIGLAAPVIYEKSRPTTIWCAGVSRSMWTTRTHFLHRGHVELPREATWSTDDMPDAFAIPRRVLELVDGFDELHFPFHYEEGDIAQRIRALGFRAIVLRDAAVWHSGGTDTDPGIEMFRGFELNGQSRVQYMAYARVYFHRKYSPFIQKVIALVIFVPVWALLVSVACVRQRKTVRAKRDVILAIVRGLIRGYARRDGFGADAS